MNRKSLLLLGFILVKFLLQFTLIHSGYDLHRDEYLHLDQGNHLAWGYASVPPFTSWISWVILALGKTVFWVKFFPALFGALTLLVVWKTIETIKGGYFALLLGGVSILISVLLRINTLYQPNSPDVFFWTLSAWLLISYINTAQPKWIYWLALSVGFGLLNKYNILFWFIAILPAVLLSPQRKLLFNKHFIGAFLLGLLIVLPNLLWQVREGFPVLQHMHELATTQLDKVNRVDFVKEQLLFFPGAFFVWIAGLLGLCFYPPLARYRFFFYSFWLTIAVFLLFKAKPYYAIGLYPVYLAFGAVYLESLLQGRRGKYLKPVALLLPVLAIIPMLDLAFPNKAPEAFAARPNRYRALGMLRWEDGKEHAIPQDFADMLGWRELAAKVDSARKIINDDAHTIIICDNYGQAGAINYYSQMPGLPALGFTADYVNWFNLDRVITQVILVKDQPDSDSSRTKEKPLFESVDYFDEITSFWAREKGSKIYLLRNARQNISPLLRKMLDQRKKENR